MGTLHAYEKALVLLVAFGPFLVLVVVVYVVRRRHLTETAATSARAEVEPGRVRG